MRTQFVNTSNSKAFDKAMVALGKRGASEACLLVVDGIPGLGKTTTLNRWVAQNGCLYLRAKKTWSASWFMKEVLNKLRVEPPHSKEKKFGAILQELGARQAKAVREGRQFALVIDEADHISNRPEIMETARDIADMLELPVILIGMGKVRDHLTRFPQMASRVSQFVRFEKANLDDVTKFVDALCEIKVAPDLVKFIHQASDGMNREVIEAIATVERFGRMQDLGEGGLSMCDMAGEMLMNDRRSGEPIFVPEVI